MSVKPYVDEAGNLNAPSLAPSGKRWMFHLVCDLGDSDMEDTPDGVAWDGGWWIVALVDDVDVTDPTPSRPDPALRQEG